MPEMICSNCGHPMVKDREADEKDLKITGFVLLFAPLLYGIIFSLFNFQAYDEAMRGEVGLYVYFASLIAHLLGALGILWIIYKSKATTPTKRVLMLIPAIFLLFSILSFIVLPSIS